MNKKIFFLCIFTNIGFSVNFDQIFEYDKSTAEIEFIKTEFENLKKLNSGREIIKKLAELLQNKSKIKLNPTVRTAYDY